MAALAIPGPAEAALPEEPLVTEASCLWTSTVEAWLAYLGRLAAARSPLAVLEAGAQLAGDSFQICDRAATLRLRGAGVLQPLMTDC